MNRRTTYLAAAMLFAAVVALGFATKWGVFANADRAWLSAILLRETRSPGWQVDLARWVTWLGNGEQRTIIMVAFAGWLAWDRRFRAALVMLVIPALASVTSSLLKEAFARSRPDIAPHLDRVTELSYPSGHATGAMALMVLAALIIPQRHRPLWIAAALAYGVAMGFSRQLLAVHWPSDVLGGWMLGLAFAVAGSRYAADWEDRR